MGANPAHTEGLTEEIWADILARMPTLALLQAGSHLKAAVLERIAEGIALGIQDAAHLRHFALEPFPSLARTIRGVAPRQT